MWEGRGGGPAPWEMLVGWEWGRMDCAVPREHRDSSPSGLLQQITEFRVSSRAGSPRGLTAASGLFQDRDVQLSKALSYALRHGALKLGLPMGPGK